MFREARRLSCQSETIALQELAKVHASEVDVFSRSEDMRVSHLLSHVNPVSLDKRGKSIKTQECLSIPSTSFLEKVMCDLALFMIHVCLPRCKLSLV